MAIITKTQDIPLLPLQSVASNTVVISPVEDVSTKMSATVGIHFGRRSATAMAAGVEIRIEASMTSSGDSQWFPLVVFKSQQAAVEAEPVSGTVNAGTNVITVASTINLAAGDLVFIDNSTMEK